MDIGSAAAVGGGLSLLGPRTSISTTLMCSILTSLDHRAPDADRRIGDDIRRQHRRPGTPSTSPIHWHGPVAAESIEGTHPDSSLHEFVYIIGRIGAGGLRGHHAAGSRGVLGAGSVPASRQPRQPAPRQCRTSCRRSGNSSTDAAVRSGGAVHAQAASIQPHAAVWPAATMQVVNAAAKNTWGKHSSMEAVRTPMQYNAVAARSLCRAHPVAWLLVPKSPAVTPTHGSG